MILKSPTIGTMSTTFPQILWNCTNPDNGTIQWSTACQAAKEHGLWDDFRTDYGTTASFGGVDTGEFLVWLGY
jgi:hypothetical protein